MPSRLAFTIQYMLDTRMSRPLRSMRTWLMTASVRASTASHWSQGLLHSWRWSDRAKHVSWFYFIQRWNQRHYFQVKYMERWEPTGLALIFRYTFVEHSNNSEKEGKCRVWKSYSDQVWFINKRKSLMYRRKDYASCVKNFLTLQHNFWNNEQ